MKKVIVLVAAFGLTMVMAGTSMAQNIKIGIFDEQNVLALMPGIQKVDTLLNQYMTDSLNEQRDYAISEFKRKDSIFKADSAKMNSSMKSIMQRDLADQFAKLQNWQQYQNQMMQQKQAQLLQPFYDIIGKAFQEVMAEQKYTYVFKPDALLYAEKSEELTLRVLAKMKIPLPKEIQDQIKALGISTSGTTTPAPAKPPVKH
ncbi:OmpH family outer membrane protein [Hydrotalea sandarakina]|jgi:Skp family chaperone for outer membrane proteins|uniref:Skp family chaperone for outer membrane proteins n=1 Tax=Hydrotalea sandarakina TaxID=1004304 RepID=A0A2W7S777_9BACT|nr:OmpH family outer membrane protein [Hydrotalea sandarakina]PZX62809.1 Skp family chaperone for outer membrane proteins [Hydrotalea sandarakina]